MTFRVAFFTETFLPKIDGITTITCLLLEHLRRVDAEAIVFAGGERVDSYAGYPVVSMPGLPVPMYPELAFSLPVRDEYEQLRQFNPDVIHVLNPVTSGLGGMYFAKKLNTPLVTSFHTHLMEMARFYGYGAFEDVLWWLHRQAYQRADRVLATSQQVVNELTEQGFGDVRLWRRGVDWEQFSPSFATPKMRNKLSDGQPDKPLLLSVGRLAPEKQVEQIKPVLDAVPEAHLAIVGDGPYREELEKIYEGYSVTFAGYMSGDELSCAYASADLFVFPTSSIETFGLVAAEALASGLPVVASRVGGMPEIVQPGVNGHMFEENDVEQMTEYVRELVRQPEKRQSFGQAARESVSHLSWTAIMDELFDIYTELIHDNQRRSPIMPGRGPIPRDAYEQPSRMQ